MDQVCTIFSVSELNLFGLKNKKWSKKIDKSAGSGTKTFRPPKNEALFYV
jgi:hypothetical protein